VACRRHPWAAQHQAHCAACLLEQAIGDVSEQPVEGARQLRLQVPLGETASTSVFVVKSEGSPSRLLRLKIWRRPAEPGFLARFHQLQHHLDTWAAEDLLRPLAAVVDGAGCPSVLSDFTRGVPLLDRVRSGRLDSRAAIASLAPVLALVERAHAHGLAHGAVVPGNVLVDCDSGQARLLDFGLTPLLIAAHDGVALASSDRLGFAVLTKTLRNSVIRPDSTRGL
jgi:serine/threonine protein kinase